MFNMPQQFVDFNMSNVEKAVRLANAALDGMGRLVQLQFRTTQHVLAENAKRVNDLASASNPQEWITVASSTAQPRIETGLAYSRALYDIAVETQVTINQVVEEQAKDFNKNLESAIDTAARATPAATDAAAAAARSAMASANSVYDAISKSSAQTVDATRPPKANGSKGVASKNAQVRRK